MDEVRRLVLHDVAATWSYAPNVFAAAAILVLGALFGWVAGRFVAKLSARLGFDTLGERTGLVDDLARVGLTLSPSRLVGRMAFFGILAATFVQAVNALDLAPISASLGIFLTDLPHVVLAAILVLAGIVVGDTVGRGTAGAMSRSGVLYHDVAHGVLRSAIILLFVLMALEQLTVAAGFLLYVILVALGGAALAAGIAGGWGARAFAENIVAGRYVEHHLKIGEFIRIGDYVGEVERLGATSTVVRTSDGRSIIFPNGYLARSVVESAKEPIGTV